MANDILAAALDYAKRGWPIIPCRPLDKSPYTEHGVLDSTTDAKRIQEWWARWPRATIGLDVGGAGMMALDFDTKHGKTMAELIAGLEERLGEKLPETKLRARSPSGGEHWFYALGKDDIVPTTASRIAPHVDVRSHNGYVVAAPSAGYEWLSQGKPHHRTAAMLDTARTAIREKSADRDNWIIDPDLPENIDRAVDWLKTKAKIAIQGQGGDAMAYATAAYLKSLGISPELATDLMWEHWNPRCNPPWSADEMGHFESKIENGYTYNTSPPGNCTPAYRKARAAEQFKPVQTATDNGGWIWERGRFRIIDRSAINKIEPPEWLLDDCLPAGGYALLVAAAKSFKTFIALDMALTIATGGLMMDPKQRLWAPNKAGRVLYVLGEGRANVANRIKAWETLHNAGQAAGNFFLGDPVPHPESEQWDPFIKTALDASEGEPYALVVLDTIGRSMQGRNVNAQEDASQFTMLVQELQRGLGGTVLALAHVGHGQAERATGSQVWDADPDTVLIAERADPKGFAVDISMRKQKDAPEWEARRHATLQKVETSLAVISRTQQQQEARAAGREVQSTAKVVIIANVIDNAIKAVLGANKAATYSDRDLSEILTTRPEIDLGSDTIRKNHLKPLRENKKTYAFKAYDAALKRWRFSG